MDPGLGRNMAAQNIKKISSVAVVMLGLGWTGQGVSRRDLLRRCRAPENGRSIYARQGHRLRQEPDRLLTQTPVSKHGKTSPRQKLLTIFSKLPQSSVSDVAYPSSKVVGYNG